MLLPFLSLGQSVQNSSFFDPPPVYVIEVPASQVARENRVIGKVTVLNNGASEVGGIALEISLRAYSEKLGFAESAKPTAAVAKEKLPLTFSVNPKSQKSVDFSYNFPSTLPAGKYLLRAQLLLPNDIRLGWKDIIISLEPKGETVLIDVDDLSVSLVQGELLPGAHEGHIIDPTKELRGSFKAKNPTSKSITAESKAKLYYFTDHHNVIREDSLGVFVFKAGETKSLKFVLPTTKDPGSYHQHVAFYLNNQPISKEIDFMWSIEGDAGGIINAQLDADFYRRGEKAKVNIVVIGPPSGAGFVGLLKLSIQDAQNMECGKWDGTVSIKEADGTWNSIIAVPISKDCNSPRLLAELSRKDGKILSNFTANYESDSEKAKKDKAIGGNNIYFIFGFFAVIAIGAWFIIRKKHISQLP